MRIVSIRHTNSEHRFGREAVRRRVRPASSAEKTARDAKKPAPSTALVATEREAGEKIAGDRAVFVRYRPDAAFLTHLIAMGENVPQLRARRRADPDFVIESYSRAEASARLLLPGRVVTVAY